MPRFARFIQPGFQGNSYGRSIFYIGGIQDPPHSTLLKLTAEIDYI